MLKKIGLMCLACLLSTVAMAFDLNELQKQLQAPNNIKGSFTQQRFLKNLSKPIHSQGQFVLIPNSGMLWQMQKPFVDSMRVNKKGVQVLNAQKKWVSLPASGGTQKNQVKLFLDLLGGQTSGLQQQFQLNLSGSAQQWQLQLLPKTALMKQIFTKIDIAGGNVVQKINLYEKQGDRTEISLSNSNVNVNLNAFEKTALLP